MSPQIKGIKAKRNKWSYIKLKNFLHSIGYYQKSKTYPAEWKKIFANDIFHKALISKIYKEFTQHQKNKQPRLKK